MKCNQICKWNSNAGCVKPYGVPCILENVSPTGRKATNADSIRVMNEPKTEILPKLRRKDGQLTILRRGGVNYKVGKVQQEANATNDVVDSEFSTF